MIITKMPNKTINERQQAGSELQTAVNLYHFGGQKNLSIREAQHGTNKKDKLRLLHPDVRSKDIAEALDIHPSC